MKIAVQGQAADVEVIRELLSPWNVSFTNLDEAEVVVVYKEKPLETKKTIIIPSDSADFIKWVKDIKLRVVRKPGEPISIASNSQTVLTITPRMLYYYDGLTKSASGNNSPTMSELNENQIFLTLDIIKEYNKILNETLNAKTSTVYSLVTGLPVPYNLAPKQLRDLFMRRNVEQDKLSFCDKLPLDALRFILVRTIENLVNKKLQRKMWIGKKHICLLTHDVETRNGLQKAKAIRRLEEKYGVPSAWYIPSKHYKSNIELIKELANHGEVGVHGTKHDGKLIQLSTRKLLERLNEAKQVLEKIINCSVKGFRAPLLQHNINVIRALNRAGYTYDTSIPTWEPKHPSTMRPHGIGTVYPIQINGILEIPVTLPQDHQMIHILGMAVRQTVNMWLEMKDRIRELGGLCSFLVHPEYEFSTSKGLVAYEELLNTIKSDNNIGITVPSEISKDHRI